MKTLKIKCITDKAKLPQYAHPHDAGLDIFSVENVEIKPGDTAIIKTGIMIELPKNTEAQIRPRSGLALKNQITVLNTPGTIDESYRGEVRVILINHSKEVFKVEEGMKIAQMVIKPVIKVNIEKVDVISETKRGAKGFGSTGV